MLTVLKLLLPPAPSWYFPQNPFSNCIYIYIRTTPQCHACETTNNSHSPCIAPMGWRMATIRGTHFFLIETSKSEWQKFPMHMTIILLLLNLVCNFYWGINYWQFIYCILYVCIIVTIIACPRCVMYVYDRVLDATHDELVYPQNI